MASKTPYHGRRLEAYPVRWPARSSKPACRAVLPSGVGSTPTRFRQSGSALDLVNRHQIGGSGDPYREP